MGENISDVDMERFLRRRDRISREYRALEGEGPTAALDKRVLEEARAALEQDARASGWRRGRWPTITALAATVLLSLGLIVRVALESDQEVFVPPLPDRQRPANDEFSATPPAVGQPSAPPPARAPDPIPPELPRPRIEGPIQTGAERAKLAAPVDTRAQSRERFEEKRRDADATPPAELMKQEALRTQQAIEAAPAAAEPSAPAESESDATRDYASRKDDVDSARAPKAAQRVLENSNTAGTAQRMRDPEAWLDEIDALRTAGRIEEADRELERFRAAYPRYLEEHPRPPGP
jgi:hypothetical protein